MKKQTVYFVILSAALTACSTSEPKPIVQQPLQLSGPNDILNHSCGEFGCDDIIQQKCGNKTLQILEKKFADNSTNQKDPTTGVWINNKKQSTHYSFRCVN